jgi:hypothetical protein
MTHFSVLVIGDDVDKAMAPYQENNFGTTEDRYLVTEKEDDGSEYTYNPNSFFDYYSEGGRYRDKILTKSGALVNKAMKADIDFDTMYAEAIEKAKERYDMAMAIFGELPPHKSLEEITKRMQSPDEIYPTSQTKISARKVWKAQPRVIAFETAVEADTFDKYMLFPDDYIISRKEYVEDCKMRRFSTYGFLIANPDEHDEGRYECRDHLSEKEYYKAFHEALAEADDDAMITILDCHV